MRLTALLVALVAAASAVSGQETATPTGLSVHGLPVTSAVERPRDVVARLAREAMAMPGDSLAWRALASALPSMALTGDADLEGTFEAARVADSLAAAGAGSGGIFPAPQPPPPGEPAPDDPVGASRLPVPSLPIPRVALGGLVLLVASGLVGWRVRAGRRRLPRSQALRHHPEAGLLWTARTLAGGGASLPEIARRTGMSQEAVNLALALGGAGPVTAPHPSPRPSPRARPDDERLRREVTAAAGRLRDGRLTYGGAGAGS